MNETAAIRVTTMPSESGLLAIRLLEAVSIGAGAEPGRTTRIGGAVAGRYYMRNSLHQGLPLDASVEWWPDGNVIDKVTTHVLLTMTGEEGAVHAAVGVAGEILTEGEPPIVWWIERGDDEAPEVRTFPLAAFITVVHDVFLGELGPVHDLLEAMTGERPITAALPRFCDEVRSTILDAYPWLAACRPPEFAPEIGHHRRASFTEVWLGKIAGAYGAEHPAPEFDPLDHTSIDPAAEIGMKMSGS